MRPWQQHRKVLDGPGAYYFEPLANSQQVAKANQHRNEQTRD